MAHLIVRAIARACADGVLALRADVADMAVAAASQAIATRIAVPLAALEAPLAGIIRAT